MSEGLKIKIQLEKPELFDKPDEVYLVGNANEGYSLDTFHRKILRGGSPYYINSASKGKLADGRFLIAIPSIVWCIPLVKKNVSLITTYISNQDIDPHTL